MTRFARNHRNLSYAIPCVNRKIFFRVWFFAVHRYISYSTHVSLYYRVVQLLHLQSFCTRSLRNCYQKCLHVLLPSRPKLPHSELHLSQIFRIKHQLQLLECCKNDLACKTAHQTYVEMNKYSFTFKDHLLDYEGTFESSISLQETIPSPTNIQICSTLPSHKQQH